MLTLQQLQLKMHSYFQHFQQVDHPLINQNPVVRKSNLKKNDTFLIFHNIISFQTILTCERVWSNFNTEKSILERYNFHSKKENGFTKLKQSNPFNC